MTRARHWVWLATVALLPLGACHGLFDVQSPGKIQDADLNTPVAVPGIVTGMSYDMARALNNSSEALSLLSVELYHGGSYNWGDLPRGIVKPEDVNGTWEAMFRPRFTTTAGIERIKKLLPTSEFDKSADVARAYMLAGFANRHLGENVCKTINPTTGVPEPNTAEFDRGIANFGQAIQIGGNAGGAAADSFVTAAYGGRASLEAWKGDWTSAVADAVKVPAAFVLTAPLMVDGLSNTLDYETHSRFEYTVWSTEAAMHYGDPRVPWDTLYNKSGKIAVGANGSTPMFQQRKYDDLGANIPLTKGTEMLVLRAEAALRESTPDVAGAYALMNQERAQYGMNPLTPSVDINQAWADLHWERTAVTWLEGRHLWDERRWFAESGPAHYDIPKTEGDPTATLADRAMCIPISKDELQSNPNIPAGP